MILKDIIYVGPNRLYVESHIPEQPQHKTPLLFIHGRHGSAVDWKYYLEFFSKKGWRCYTVSLRGHYMSKPVNISKISFMDYVQDIKEVVHAIKQPPVIIGFSMGGRVAQKYSESHKVKALILLNSTEPKGTMRRTASPSLLEKIPDIVSPDKEALMQAIGEDMDEKELDNIYKTLSKESGRVIREMMTGIEVNPHNISCPVLVIDTDSLAKCKRLAGFYNADYIFIKGINHSGVIWGQRWEEIATEIHTWLLKTFPM